MTLISYNGPRPKDVIAKYGRCLELIPTDKRFNEISVGLYAVSYTHLTLPTIYSV